MHGDQKATKDKEKHTVGLTQDLLLFKFSIHMIFEVMHALHSPFKGFTCSLHRYNKQQRHVKAAN